MAAEPVKDDDPTIGKLVADVSRDISTLISKEIALAKTELKVSLKFGAVGAGMFAAAGFLVVLAVIMLSVSIAYFISRIGIGLDFAFLIVFALYVAIAGALAFLGLKQVKQVGPPEKAIEQGKEIPKALKGKS